MRPNTSNRKRAAAELPPFDYQPRTRVVFGAGTVDRLGKLARELGGRQVLLVSDPGLVAAGHAKRAGTALAAAGLRVVLFDGVEPNPTTEHVAAGLAVAKAHGVELIVGLGGGSAMDCAKGVNFLLTNGGAMRDYRGVGKATKPMLPMIAIPTTAGTGSEAQSFALIADPETHAKMACGDTKAACRVAILDAALTVSQPTEVTVASGIDAIAHAIETCASTRSTGLSRMLSREAWRLLESNFETVLCEPENIEARGAMQLGAHHAGAAIEQSMLGAAHACANPLTAHHGITHGVAVGIVLPHVIRFNAPHVGEAYDQLVSGQAVARGGATDPGEWLASRVEALLRAGGLAERLSAHGVGQEHLPDLAQEAAQQWTGRFNPRPVDAGGLLDIYRRAM